MGKGKKGSQKKGSQKKVFGLWKMPSSKAPFGALAVWRLPGGR